MLPSDVSLARHMARSCTRSDDKTCKNVFSANGNAAKESRKRQIIKDLPTHRCTICTHVVWEQARLTIATQPPALAMLTAERTAQPMVAGGSLWRFQPSSRRLPFESYLVSMCQAHQLPVLEVARSPRRVAATVVTKGSVASVVIDGRDAGLRIKWRTSKY